MLLVLLPPLPPPSRLHLLLLSIVAQPTAALASRRRPSSRSAAAETVEAEPLRAGETRAGSSRTAATSRRRSWHPACLLGRSSSSAAGGRPVRPTVRLRRAASAASPSAASASASSSPHLSSPSGSPAPSAGGTAASRDWVDDDDPTAIDRQWYDADEESGVALDDESRAFLTDAPLPAPAAAAASATAPGAASTARSGRGLSVRAQQLRDDGARWEENRLLQSGVVTAASVDTDFTDETEHKVSIVVQDVKPPFLDGRIAYTTQQEMVSTVRDPTSDLAVIARKGSALLSTLREKAERGAMKDKFWQVAGSHLGNVIGVKQPEEAGGEGGKAAAAVKGGAAAAAGAGQRGLSPVQPVRLPPAVRVCSSERVQCEPQHRVSARVPAHLLVQGRAHESHQGQRRHRHRGRDGIGVRISADRSTARPGQPPRPSRCCL